MSQLPVFVHHSPTQLSELLELMGRLGASARIIAGGTELLPKMRASRLQPEHVVGIRRIADLARVTRQDDGSLRIGAGVRLADVASHPQVQADYPALARSCTEMATTQIRNMATVAGNLVNGSPCADTAGPLLVHEALVEIGAHSASGGVLRRTLALGDFFVGPGAVALEPGEVLLSILVPAPPPRSSSAYVRHSARSRVDVAAASASALVQLRQDGTIEGARVAIGAVAPTPLRCPTGEALLAGATVSDALLREAAEACAAIAKPIDDVRASAAYRRAVLPVLVRRALAAAVTSAGEASSEGRSS